MDKLWTYARSRCWSRRISTALCAGVPLSTSLPLTSPFISYVNNTFHRPRCVFRLPRTYQHVFVRLRLLRHGSVARAGTKASCAHRSPATPWAPQHVFGSAPHLFRCAAYGFTTGTALLCGKALIRRGAVIGSSLHLIWTSLALTRNFTLPHYSPPPRTSTRLLRGTDTTVNAGGRSRNIVRTRGPLSCWQNRLYCRRHRHYPQHHYKRYRITRCVAACCCVGTASVATTRRATTSGVIASPRCYFSAFYARAPSLLADQDAIRRRAFDINLLDPARI